MQKFNKLKENENIQELIKVAFDTDLDIKGSWGYAKETATDILSTTVPLAQFEHMFASMRAYVEMNMTLPEEERYGSINLNEVSREQINIDDLLYDKVKYEITAINEKIYASFISEYKEGYGTEGFDLEAHFKKRKEATLQREAIHWFEISSI